MHGLTIYLCAVTQYCLVLCNMLTNLPMHIDFDTILGFFHQRCDSHRCWCVCRGRGGEKMGRRVGEGYRREGDGERGGKRRKWGDG